MTCWSIAQYSTWSHRISTSPAGALRVASEFCSSPVNGTWPGFICLPRDSVMKIAFVNQPWNQIEPRNPQGSVPIWTSQVAQRLSTQHEVYIYSRRFRETPRDETDGDLRYVRVSAPFDPWVTRIVRLMMGL